MIPQHPIPPPDGDHAKTLDKLILHSSDSVVESSIDIEDFTMVSKRPLRPNQGNKPTNNANAARTLLVYRVSRQSSTTENQKWGMDAFRKTLKRSYAILDITATSWKKAIPQFTNLLAEIESGKWDEIAFWAVDRTGRDIEFDQKLWTACVRNNVVLKFVGQGLSSERDSDRQMFEMLSLVGAWERRAISARTRLGLQRRKQEAESQGKTFQIGGKVKGQLWGKTVKAVPIVLTLLREGHSLRQIAETTHLGYRCVASIRDTPIDQLRKSCGNDKLQPWR